MNALSFEFGEGWTIAPPWTDAKLREIHGVYVTHVGSGLQLHIGLHGANAALAHSHDTGHDVIEACERVMDTLKLEAGD